MFIQLISADDFTFLLLRFLFSENPQLARYLKISFPQAHFSHSLVTSATWIPLFPHIFNFSLYWLVSLWHMNLFFLRNLELQTLGLICLFSDNYSPPAFTFQGLPSLSRHLKKFLYFILLLFFAFKVACFPGRSPVPSVSRPKYASIPHTNKRCLGTFVFSHYPYFPTPAPITI